MNVKKLKELIDTVPDNYEVRSRAGNAHLRDDEKEWQDSFSGDVHEVNVVHKLKKIVLIRGFE